MDSTYYSDNEIVEMIQEALVNSEDADKIANLVRDRFSRKDRQREYCARRLRLAAEHIGFNLIEELETYE